MAQFAQCLCFNLAYALTGHVELLTYFFQSMIGVHFNSKTHAQHLGFAWRKRIKYILGEIAQSARLAVRGASR